MNSNRIAILGSTGSVGCNALEVIQHLGAPWNVTALGANRNIKKLAEQIARHQPPIVAVAHKPSAAELRESIDSKTVVLSGPNAMSELAASDSVDVVLAAIVGAAGVRPVYEAIRAGKKVALANKESLVVAGSVLMPLARERGVSLLPVDSEHSAIFQAMLAGRRDEIRRVILTASGGPFRTWSSQQIERATLADALNHPTWRMGNKISIDSATMFNKALELIEACWLFDLEPEQIEVVVHPESLVHSMVEFVDGSVLAQLSPPDMRTPIQYALTYPHRMRGISRKLDLSQTLQMNFEPPDPQRFPALRLGYAVARARGAAGAVMNAANEVAVEAFIAGRIRFGMISQVVELTIASQASIEEPSLDELLTPTPRARRGARSNRSAAIAVVKIGR